MKLPASAPPARKHLTLAFVTGVAIALLACAAAFSSSEHLPLWPQLALAEESAVEMNAPGVSAEEPTQSPPPSVPIAPTIQNPGAPAVSLAMDPADLGFLLTAEERALVEAGKSVKAYLEATPLGYDGVLPPNPNASTGASGGTASENNGDPVQSPPSEQGAKRPPPEGLTPPPAPKSMVIKFEDLKVMTDASAAFFNYGDVMYNKGNTPFDISLFVKVGDAEARQVTGTLPTPITLSVTLTDEIISGTQGMGETFCFVVFHEYRDGSGVLTPEQVSLELGSEEKLTIPVAVRSFSPFIIAWGDVPPIPATAPGGGGGGIGGNEAASGSGSGGEGTSGGTPSTPAPPQTPEPAPPAANDSAPEAAAPATPARPFLAWSPSQTRRSIALRWTPAEGADGYLVYGCRCNHGGVKRTPVLITELGPSATSWTERRLPAGEWHKYVVRAFRYDGDRRVILARSPQVHAVTLGGKSRTARGVQITSARGDDGRPLALREPDPTSSGLQILELSAGQRVTIATRELGRRLTVHHRPMRYTLWSASAGSAPIVSKDGTFTLQQPGTYLLWAYAQSGTHHMIEVRVRE